MVHSFLFAAVNAKYIHTCLGAYDIVTYAHAHGQNIDLAEYTINEPADRILDDIRARKPDGIFFACYIWNIRFLRFLLPSLHAALPEACIYLGGPEVSYDPETYLKEFPFLGGVLAGEGEVSVTFLLAYWDSRGAIGRVIRSQRLLPMDEVPFPYDEIPPESLKNRILYYETSRGCPFSCSYCLSSRDEPVRLRSRALVERELQFFLDRKVPQVKFVDRTFNCSHAHAQVIWRYLLAHDNGITNFHFEIGADLLTKEELALLRQMRPGSVQLEIGVQSTNPMTIASVSRTMDLEKLKEAVREIHAAGNIHQHLDLIAGLPYENYERFGRSFDEIFSLAPDMLQLGFLKVLKGTAMEKMADRYGIFYEKEAPYEVTGTPWLSEEEILRLQKIARLVDIYYNSAQYTQTLPYLLACRADGSAEGKSAFSFFESLAAYYEAHGCPEVTDSRVQRYEILRDFAEETLGKSASFDRDELIEKLSLDLYLREKLKHRPSWVHDVNERYLFDYEKRDPLTYNAGMVKR